MAEDFDKLIKEMHRDLALRKKGSPAKAKKLAEKLRKMRMNEDANLLVQRANDAQRFLPKDMW